MRACRYFTVVLVMSSFLLMFLLHDVVYTTITRQKNTINGRDHFGLVQQPFVVANVSGTGVNMKNIFDKHDRLQPKDPSVLKKFKGVFGGIERVHDYIASSVNSSSMPKIPHIIHQTWDDENVPDMFSVYIKSWSKRHPDWEYWFWTPKEVKQLLATHYPQYSQLYANYSEAIYKANLMRYFIMHKYGGVYADLDLESLRPLDNWTMDNECIMSQNHYVHAYIVGDREVSEVMITFLASRPGHPYFKLAIEMLPWYGNIPYAAKLVYAETVYRKYLQNPESKKPENSMTVTHPDYFLPTYDKGWVAKVRKICRKDYKERNKIQDETCKGIHDGTDGRRPKSFSYANHYWEHVIMWGKSKEKKARIRIQDVVPHVKFPQP